MINTLYGILTDGCGIIPETPGYRYSDASATKKQRNTLLGLMPQESEQCALFVDFILKLLSCSPYWPTVLNEMDINNTYDIEVFKVTPDGSYVLSFNPMTRLVEWAETVPENGRYPCDERDPVKDQVISKLLGVLTDG